MGTYSFIGFVRIGQLFVVLPASGQIPLFFFQVVLAATFLIMLRTFLSSDLLATDHLAILRTFLATEHFYG